MGRYIAQRLLGMIPTLLLLILAVVVLVRLMPGDIVDIMLAEQAAGSTSRETLEKRFGIDDPLPVAYVQYTGNLATGDLGESLRTGQPVGEMIRDRIDVTLELATFALLMGWTVGVLIGVFSAITQDSPFDYLLRGFAILGLTIPSFALATAVFVLPAIYWNWSPPIFYTRFGDDPVAHLQQFILPALVLAASLMGAVMRITRTQMLEVLRQDYIRTARAKGLQERTIIIRHTLRNAVIPVISVFGLQVAFLMSGTVIIENIFALPGLGRLLLDAVAQRDYPVIQGVTVVIGLAVMLVNLLVDVSYGMFDPRLRAGGPAR